MSNEIKIDPQVMREVGVRHDDVAEQIAAARMAGEEIAAAVDTYGPIMHQVKAAVADMLAQRETALLEHEQAHRHAAQALRTAAARFAEQEAVNTERLTF